MSGRVLIARQDSLGDVLLAGPYGVPHALLGDQDAPCRGTRARPGR